MADPQESLQHEVDHLIDVGGPEQLLVLFDREAVVDAEAFDLASSEPGDQLVVVDRIDRGSGDAAVKIGDPSGVSRVMCGIQLVFGLQLLRQFLGLVRLDRRDDREGGAAETTYQIERLVRRDRDGRLLDNPGIRPCVTD